MYVCPNLIWKSNTGALDQMQYQGIKVMWIKMYKKHVSERRNVSVPSVLRIYRRESEGKEGFPIFIGAASTNVAINPPSPFQMEGNTSRKAKRDIRDIRDISKWQESQGNNLQSEKRH